jgi:hypothetical protein
MLGIHSKQLFIGSADVQLAQPVPMASILEWRGYRYGRLPTPEGTNNASF